MAPYRGGHVRKLEDWLRKIHHHTNEAGDQDGVKAYHSQLAIGFAFMFWAQVNRTWERKQR